MVLPGFPVEESVSAGIQLWVWKLLQARSSVGEHYLDTVGVGGSIPPAPTKRLKKKRESS